MVTITLEIPNELAERLAVEHDRLPAVLELGLDALAARPSSSAWEPGKRPRAFSEMIRLLSSYPSREQVLAFRISPDAQERLADLLEKNGEEELTDAERAELDWYEYVHDLMTRLKAEARVGSVG